MSVGAGSSIIRNVFGVSLSRGASLAAMTADHTVNDYIMPSHMLKNHSDLPKITRLAENS